MDAKLLYTRTSIWQLYLHSFDFYKVFNLTYSKSSSFHSACLVVFRSHEEMKKSRARNLLPIVYRIFQVYNAKNRIFQFRSLITSINRNVGFDIAELTKGGIIPARLRVAVTRAKTAEMK